MPSTAQAQDQESADVEMAPDSPLDAGDSKYSVVVEGSYAYVLVYPERDIAVFDISEPLSPRLVGRVPARVNGKWGPFDAEGDHLYVLADLDEGDEENGMYVFDVSNPADPLFVGFYGHWHEFELILIEDQTAYLSSSWYDTTMILDVSDPSLPTYVTSVGMGCCNNGIRIVDEYAYFVTDVRVVIYDISDRLAPVQLSYFVPIEPPELHSAWILDMAVNENFSYVSWKTGGSNDRYYLTIFDIRDATNPIQVDLVEIPWWVRNLIIEDGLLYFSLANSHPGSQGMESGIGIYDVSNPQDLRLVGLWDVSGDVYSLDIKDNCVFSAPRVLDSLGIKRTHFTTFCLSSTPVVWPTPTATPTSTPTPTTTPTPSYPLFMPLLRLD